MPHYRLFSTLLAVALLGGCGKESQVVFSGGGGTNMDSPILVSDELHIRHAHIKSGAKPDFFVPSSGPVTASSDSGNELKSIKCEAMKTATTSGSTPPNCIDSAFSIASGRQWQIDVYASMDGSGSSLLTLMPTAAMPPCLTALTYCQVSINSYTNLLGGTEDDGSRNKDNDTIGGTDMAMYDTTGKLLDFASVKLTDNSTSSSTIMQCKNPGSAHDCKIRIKYK